MRVYAANRLIPCLIPWCFGAWLALFSFATGCSDIPDDGTPPSVTPIDTDEPQFVVSPSPVDFGKVLLEQTARATLTLKNEGDADLYIGSVAMTADGGGVYALSSSFSATTLEPGTFITLELTFTPHTASAYGGTIEVQTNDEDLPLAQVPLLGEGTLGTDEDGDGSTLEQTPPDCDDADPDTYPGAPELCDDKDNDCDGEIDEETDYDGDGTSDCSDDDGDGYTEDNGDCNDQNPDQNPGEQESCNGFDDDCNGAIDDAPSQDEDLDGYTVCAGDCDDSSPLVNPGAAEVCNGVDDNCDGTVDEGFDGDGDGTPDCTDEDGDGYSEDGGDCNDVDPEQNPGELERCNGLDDNCDGTADEGTGDDDDLDGYSECDGDCNDLNADIYPNASEVCNGVDDDCDGAIDDGLPTTPWYRDGDSDSYGNPLQSADACFQPTGYVSNAGDCDDGNPAIHPGAEEICNGVDDDCDGLIDDGYDTDGDGYTSCDSPNSDCDDTDPGTNPSSDEACDGEDDNCDGTVDEGYDEDQDGTSDCTDDDGDGETEADGDCNDDDPTTYDGAPEVCDGVDNDCDGEVDEGFDGDGDGTPDCTDEDGDGYSEDGGDCDDTDPSTHPEADEICDGQDDDCDGQSDEGIPTTLWFEDNDDDGYGTASSTQASCRQPEGFVGNDDDCNDGNPTIHPGAPEQCNGIDDDCDGAIDDGVTDSTWYRDADGDGYGTSSDTKVACSKPSGYVLIAADCNDANAAISPMATEVCNGVDDDCDVSVDEGVKTTFYRDADADGFGTPNTTQAACSAPSGYVANATDCDDANGAVHPGATETCNAIDDDCDTFVDEGLTTSTWYRDSDGDGYGDPANTRVGCSKPSGYVAGSGDCNDTNAAIHPGATEACNAVDDDCDGSIDEGVTSSFYVDADGDGYGKSGSTAVQACSRPTGYSANATDCDDTKASIYPGASETCNGIDDDCDALIDDGVSTSTWYRDADNDTYGTSSDTKSACAQPSGYVSRSGDCNDASPAVNPGATELCNGIDDDCDGSTDEGVLTSYYVDGDADGYGKSGSTAVLACSKPTGYSANATDCDDTKASIHPGATEQCNGIDDDCDAAIDEGVTTSTWYRDADSDTYGISSDTKSACSQPTGYASRAGDCNDGNAAINPGASEVCNGIDDDCDSVVDDGVKSSWYPDGDGDGYGQTGGTSTQACTKPSGYVANDDDCNDANTSVNPAAVEHCNGIDDDCDGSVDEGFGDCDDSDDDGDGWTENEGDCDDTSSAIAPILVDGGYGEGGNGSPDSPFNTIQEGIDHASLTCPLVLVEPYTYLERIDYGGKNVTVRATEGPEVTTIDGGALGSVVTFKLSENSSAALEGFTVTHGLADYGGGVYIKGASPLLQDNIFVDNTVNRGGGGVYAVDGAPTLLGNVFEDNAGPTATGSTATAGGALLLDTAPAIVQGNTFTGNVHLLGGAIALIDRADALIGGPSLASGNTFTGNSATDTSSTNGAGGAIYVYNSKPVLQQNTFTGNSASDAGGGLYLISDTAVTDAVVELEQNTFTGNTTGDITASASTRGIGGAICSSKGTIILTDSVLTGNIAAYLGGGIYMKNSSSIDATGNTLTGNQARHTTLAAGGGVYIASSSGVLQDNTLSANTSYYNGGGIVLFTGAAVDLLDNTLTGNSASVSSSGKGGGIYIASSSGTVEGNLLQGNNAGDSGGGLMLQDADVTVVHNRLLQNTAKSKGGGIFVTTGSSSIVVDITNNLFQDNMVTAGYGGGIAFSNKNASVLSYGRFINNTLVGNSATGSGAGIYIGQESYAVVMNNIVYKSLMKEGIYLYTASTPPPVYATVTYNDSDQNAGSDYGGQLLTSLDASNRSDDPLFVAYSADGNASNDNLHLQSSSPLRNKGNPAAAYDDTDGTDNDMGAYGGPDGGW